MKGNLRYRINEPLNLNTARDFYRQSTLAMQRPSEYSDAMRQMLKCANLVISAWDEDQLVGISRAMTDFCYIAFLADLAVHQAYHHNDIKKRLIMETLAQLAPGCLVVIIASPSEEHYYNGFGFVEHKPTYIIKAECLVC